MKELSGKPVVITGAGQGLGRAYALAIAAAGGRVVVNDRNADNAKAVVAEIQAAGGEAILSTDPVGTVESADAIVRTCTDAFGSIYGLINNAAIHAEALSWEESPAHVENVLQVNILGSWHTGVAAIRAMRATGEGVIINVASGAMLGVPTMAIYGASKAAVQSFTVAWAKELEGSGVRVLGISPWSRTPMLLGAPESMWAKHGPEVAAPLAVYLLTARAAFLNGQMVRTAEGQKSLYLAGTYGPILGERLDWTSDTLHAAFLQAINTRIDGFMPQNANS